jgi:hypothetical protein
MLTIGGGRTTNGAVAFQVADVKLPFGFLLISTSGCEAEFGYINYTGTVIHGALAATELPCLAFKE